MSPASNRTGSTRRKSRRWSLLLLVGLPLVALHAALLLERAIHRETLDAIVVLRWALAVVLLALMNHAAPRIRSLNSPAVAIAAILIFALIHLPVTAPEPGAPLAATGLGLALALVVADRRCGALSFGSPAASLTRPAFPGSGPSVSRDSLQDRAPPLFQ